MTTDEQLLQQYARERSESAFSQLVTRHLDLVFSAAIRVVNGDTHLAQDVTQTVFIDLARKAGNLPRHVVLSGWLHRHTGYTAATVVRTERRRQSREQTAMEMRALDEHTRPEWEQVAPYLDESLNQLSPADRDALVLRFLKQQDLRTVGEALGISEDAAQKRVDRALEKLHVLLKQRGATLSAAALGTALATQAVTAAPAGLAGSITAAALASAAASGGITATLLKSMNITIIKLGIISIIIVAGLTIPLAIQQQSLARLREENQALRQQAAELAQVATDSQRNSNLLMHAKSADSLSREQTSELLRLRGEAGVLRRENAELLAAQRGGKQEEQTTAIDSSSSPRFAVHLLADAEAEDGQQMTNSRSFIDAGTHEQATRVEVLNVQKAPLIDQAAIRSASLGTNAQIGKPEIEITLTPEGASQLAKLTRENLHKRIVFVLNGQVCSTPVIQTEISSGKIPVVVDMPEDLAKEDVQKINELAGKGASH